MRSRHPLLACALLAGALGASTARAQAPGRDARPSGETSTEPAPPAPTAPASRAEVLFEEGKKLYEEKRFAEACERLAESERLDAAVGTLGLLAGCHEAQGMLATAHREFLATAELADRSKDDRGAFARQRAALLEPRLPRLTLRVAAGAAGSEILRDGAAVPASEIGVEVALDPGPHEITARAPGKQEFQAKITSTEGVRLTVEIPALAPLVAAPAPALPPEPAPPAGGGSRRTVALVVGGVGLAGLGLGAAFGVAALGKHAKSTTLEETCSTAAQCEEGEALRDSTYTLGTLSTVGFGVGIVGVGVATILLLTGDDHPASQGAKPPPRVASVRLAPSFGPEGGGVNLHGLF